MRCMSHGMTFQPEVSHSMLGRATPRKIFCGAAAHDLVARRRVGAASASGLRSRRVRRQEVNVIDPAGERGWHLVATAGVVARVELHLQGCELRLVDTRCRSAGRVRVLQCVGKVKLIVAPVRGDPRILVAVLVAD